ncbi:putative mitochondrial protein, partial [Mucuna pruriens]
MTDLRNMRFFLDIELLQKPKGIFVCRKKYAINILNKLKYLKTNIDVNGPTMDDTYFKQIVGSIMYLTVTRLDIM